MKKYLVKNIFDKNLGHLHANWRAAREDRLVPNGGKLAFQSRKNDSPGNQVTSIKAGGTFPLSMLRERPHYDGDTCQYFIGT